MGLGILEPRSGGIPVQVPGTATLLHSDEEISQKTSKDAIILVPKPSQSPRDPLVSAMSNYRVFDLLTPKSELAVMEKRPCIACNVPLDHGRRDSGLFALDCEWNPGRGIRTANREDRESVVVPFTGIRRYMRDCFYTGSHCGQAPDLHYFNQYSFDHLCLVGLDQEELQ